RRAAADLAAFLSLPPDPGVDRECSALLDSFEARLGERERLGRPGDRFSAFLDLRLSMPGLPDAVETLTTAYWRWAERRGFSPHLVHEHHGDSGGLVQEVLHVRGPFAFGWLRGESGAHRLTRREGAALVLVQAIPDVEEEPLEDFQPQYLLREVI